jgi:protein SCO1/2
VPSCRSSRLLTGEKKNLYRLARRSFFVLKPAEVKNQGDVGSDFIHTNHFVLVDQQSRIRGYYDGTNEQLQSLSFFATEKIKVEELLEKVTENYNWKILERWLIQ